LVETVCRIGGDALNAGQAACRHGDLRRCAMAVSQATIDGVGRDSAQGVNYVAFRSADIVRK
jgi:hypothetical protein